MKNFLAKTKAFFAKHWGLWLVLAVAFVVSLPFLHSLPLTGHDAPFHMFRYQGIINAWQSGQLIPQFDPAAFGGFGYAPSLFYGPLTGWVVLLLTKLFGGLTYLGVNGLMVVAIFGAALACYKLVREITGKTTPAILAAAAYTVAPYHMIDFFIRRADGEMLPFIFAPLVFLGIWRLIQKSDKNAVLPLVVGGAGMVLSHNLSALIWATLALIFVLVNWRPLFAAKNWKFTLPKFILSGTLMLLIAAVFLLPMLEARGATLYNIMNPVFAETNMGQNADAVWHRGIHFGELFFNTPVAYDLFYGLGIVAFLGLAAFFFVRKKLPEPVRKFTSQMVIFGLSAAFMTTAWFFPWQWAPSIFTVVQFPWRLLTISSFALALVAGISLYWLVNGWLEQRNQAQPSHTNKLVAVFGTILVVASAASQIALGVYHPRWEYWYDYRLSSLAESEDRTWWYGAEYEYLPARVMGCTERRQCQLKEEMPDWLLARKAAGIIRVCDASTTSPVEQLTCAGYLEYPLFYYPAYTASTTDGNSQKLEVFESPNGLVAIRVGENIGVGTGQYELDGVYDVQIATADGIEVRYGTSRATLTGFVLSAVGVAWLVVYSVAHHRHHRKQ
ncbi:MAG: hypothetical protein LBM12_00545 [Candidatus Nomurabacteria bacterium]|jgi:hypothetical protein|nr:hypothetical protein [Candidatus Nomurabacteria bacterium]